MYCQECGEAVPEDTHSCPNCGTALHQPQQQQGYNQTQHPGQPAQQSGETSTGGLVSGVSIIGGVVYGAMSFVISFIGIVILVFTELEGETNNLGFYGGDQILAFLGWFFYNAHTVPITSSTSSTSINVLETAYQTAGSATTVPKLAYYVIPVAVLFVLGYVLADRASPSDASPKEGAIAGASIAIGYGVIAVLGGNSVFTITEAGQSAGPQSGSVIMMMVLLYPVAIGGVAGYLSRA